MFSNLLTSFSNLFGVTFKLAFLAGVISVSTELSSLSVATFFLEHFSMPFKLVSLKKQNKCTLQYSTDFYILVIFL